MAIQKDAPGDKDAVVGPILLATPPWRPPPLRLERAVEAHSLSRVAVAVRQCPQAPGGALGRGRDCVLWWLPAPLTRAPRTSDQTSMNRLLSANEAIWKLGVTRET
jgi:hypothetical protein